jgi:hypothetical protein
MRCPPRAALQRSAAVQHAGAQVGERPFRFRQVLPAPVETEECLLYDVFGRSLIAQHHVCEPYKPERVIAVQRGHCDAAVLLLSRSG